MAGQAGQAASSYILDSANANGQGKRRNIGDKGAATLPTIIARSKSRPEKSRCKGLAVLKG
jgi:hypothetical protein